MAQPTRIKGNMDKNKEGKKNAQIDMGKIVVLLYMCRWSEPGKPRMQRRMTEWNAEVHRMSLILYFLSGDWDLPGVRRCGSCDSGSGSKRKRKLVSRRGVLSSIRVQVLR